MNVFNDVVGSTILRLRSAVDNQYTQIWSSTSTTNGALLSLISNSYSSAPDQGNFYGVLGKAGSKFAIRPSGSSTDLFSVDTGGVGYISGSFGICVTPSYPLHVKKASTVPQFVVEHDSSGSKVYLQTSATQGYMGSLSNIPFGIVTNDNTRINIAADGKIRLNSYTGINTDPTTSYMLDVYGLVRLQSSNVELAAVVPTYLGTSQNVDFNLYSNNTTRMTVRADGDIYIGNNLGLGVSTFGTSAAKVLAMGTGTAPSSSPADAFQQYSKDENAVAGKACWHEFTEGAVEVWHGEGVRGAKTWLTPEGGVAVKLVAGEALSAGEVVAVKVSAGADGKVWKVPTTGDELAMPIGVVYASASSDADVWIVTAGVVSVLPESGITATRGYQLFTSDAEAGRVEQTLTPTTPTHWQEVGHWLDTGSGNGAATRAVIHFN